MITKPVLDIWVNFNRETTQEKRCKCVHCGFNMLNRADVAKKHLKVCEKYQNLVRMQEEDVNYSMTTNRFLWKIQLEKYRESLLIRTYN